MGTALLFPGQGSQEAGMGRDLADSDREVMELWKKAERISGFSLRDIYWSGDEKSMAATHHLQPGLTVANFALWMRLSPRISPMAAAGHSLGEYSALAAAKVLPIEDVLELVSLRGKLMRDADPHKEGAMAAIVRLTLPQVEECVAQVAKQTGKTLVVANYNTPGQFVVSGQREAVEAMQEAVKPLKGRSLPLPVSGAFHSPLMKEAAQELTLALHAVKKSAWNNAQFPVYCNVTARGETDADLLKASLEKQMTSPVYWINTITNQWDSGARHFVECGPKGVLGKMVPTILQAHPAAMSQHTEEAPAWKVSFVGNHEQLKTFTE